MRHPDADMPERPVGVPDAVWSAVESVRSMPRVTGMRYRELPVPSTLADYGIGVEMECVADDDSRSFGDAHMASGWIDHLIYEFSHIIPNHSLNVEIPTFCWTLIR